MAVQLARANDRGGRRRRSRRHAAIADINMTPFIDVMLVLLIIFMVAAPLLTVGVPLDLPKTSAAALNIERVPVTLSLRADGKLYLQETPIGVEEIASRLQSVAKAGAEERIYVRGDRAIAYGRVAEVMAAVTGAGYKRVALVTEPEKR